MYLLAFQFYMGSLCDIKSYNLWEERMNWAAWDRSTHQDSPVSYKLLFNSCLNIRYRFNLLSLFCGVSCVHFRVFRLDFPFAGNWSRPTRNSTRQDFHPTQVNSQHSHLDATSSFGQTPFVERHNVDCVWRIIFWCDQLQSLCFLFVLIWPCCVVSSVPQGSTEVAPKTECSRSWNSSVQIQRWIRRTVSVGQRCLRKRLQGNSSDREKASEALQSTQRSFPWQIFFLRCSVDTN